MRLATARHFALSLPEAVEAPHFEKSSFRVKGKIFATVPEGGKTFPCGLRTTIPRTDSPRRDCLL
jgi:hypothetical protein